jgi:hypothetical protein
MSKTKKLILNDRKNISEEQVANIDIDTLWNIYQTLNIFSVLTSNAWNES